MPASLRNARRFSAATLVCASAAHSISCTYASADRIECSAALMTHPSLVRLFRGRVDRLADARIGAAAADVAVHGGIDVRVRRVRLLLEQRRGRHDLSGLAIAALRDVV